ncbi:MAG TPA: YdcF family protein [Candidatus Angelobacter sp.]|nr:YdcF family protein [Candidatus Angelobacter sp.]
MAYIQAQSTSPVPFENYGRRRKPSLKLILFLVLLLAFFLFAIFAARLLVRDHPEKSDVIVVLSGDSQDQRYRRGMELLRAGFGDRLLLDAPSDSSYFGHSPAEYAENFLKQDAGDMLSRVQVCPFEEDSTVTEARYIAKCLEPLHARSVLLVTSDWHTARARSVLASRLPQYHWSVAAAHDDRLFGMSWWQHREWAKTTFQEWLKVIWWNAVDRWR